MCSALLFVMFPTNVHSFNDVLRPYTFDETIFPSVCPPIRTHAKSDVGGRATHDDDRIPNGSAGP